MGINVSEMTIEEIKECFASKITDYMKEIVKNFCTDEEINEKCNQLSSSLSNSIEKYESVKRAIEEKKEEDALEKIQNVNTQISYSKFVDYFNELLNDELYFVNFLTSSKQVSGYEGSGIEYYDEGNDKILYKGMSRAIAYSVISCMAATKARKGEELIYPKEMRDYLDDYTNRCLLTRDSVPVDLYNLLGDNIYRYYFMGNGEEFHYEMKKLLSDIDLEELSSKVDKCIFNNDDSGYFVYDSLIKTALDKKNQITLN